MNADDELVEKMARAMWMADVEPYDLADRIPFEQAPDTAQDYCRAEARAALAAARPVIRNEVLEEAAGLAEGMWWQGHGNLATAPYAAAEQAGDEIAAAIRALILSGKDRPDDRPSGTKCPELDYF